MKKRILLLATGGTIASQATEEGLAPGLDGAALASLLAESVLARYDVTVRDILRLDSSNIQPEEWQLIARHVFAAREDYDGIVITHGTDTMAYTAAILSFMVRGIPIPVVLTGAQLPIEHPLSDGEENLRLALAMAASGVGGVFVAFDRKVILGTRAVKTRTTGFDAFESVNWPCVGQVSGRGLQLNYRALPARSEDPCVLRDAPGFFDETHARGGPGALRHAPPDALPGHCDRGLWRGRAPFRPAGSGGQAPDRRPGGGIGGGVQPVSL